MAPQEQKQRTLYKTCDARKDAKAVKASASLQRSASLDEKKYERKQAQLPVEFQAKWYIAFLKDHDAVNEPKQLARQQESATETQTKIQVNNKVPVATAEEKKTRQPREHEEHEPAPVYNNHKKHDLNSLVPPPPPRRSLAKQLQFEENERRLAKHELESKWYCARLKEQELDAKVAQLHYEKSLLEGGGDHSSVASAIVEQIAELQARRMIAVQEKQNAGEALAALAASATVSQASVEKAQKQKKVKKANKHWTAFKALLGISR